MSLIKEMRERIAKSGSSKKEVLYFAPDSVKRLRFLTDLEDGFLVRFHSDFAEHIYEVCHDQENGENCKLCEAEVPTLENYCWSVWDYDSNAVRIFCMKATGISPIPALIELYEEYGTLLDRDIKIKKVGKGTGSSFAVTPLDKSRFRNGSAKPYTKKQIMEIFEKAFGATETYTKKVDEEDDDDDDDTPKKKKSKKEKSLRDKYEELTFKELKSICLELGMEKKEVKAFEDEEEIIDELFSNYEEEDLEELIEELDEDE